MAICDRVTVKQLVKIASKCVRNRVRLLDAYRDKLGDSVEVLNSDYLRETYSSQHGVLGLAIFSSEG